MSDLPAYYRTSDAYASMLEEQGDHVFAGYLRLFTTRVPHGSSVVDVGCGVGTSTRLLRLAGYDALGTDLSERFLPDKEGFAAVDFEQAPFPDATFDAAGALNVLEHIARPRRLLDEMVRVVRPGGHIVIASPNLTSPLVGVRILADLALRRTPYLGLRSPAGAAALVGRNLARSAAAIAGRDAFAPRRPALATGIVGYDVDAVYWTNAAEVRRHLERRGCATLEYQTEARSAGSRLLARLLPSLAGQLAIVARVG
ncbi:MAG TPA: class I SAM-dependent methyltransferase [Solirubrobacteraceae bacterium]|jgi:SAM-dependent methyltransferase|nr:class I SAM-dependent methyltransferase [Solirubrobacteraceae bacterium]